VSDEYPLILTAFWMACYVSQWPTTLLPATSANSPWTLQLQAPTNAVGAFTAIAMRKQWWKPDQSRTNQSHLL